MGEGDLEEVEGDAPIGVIGVGRQRLDLRPRRALDDHVVDQRRKIAGERVSLSRRRGDQRRLGRIDDEPPVGANRADRPFQRFSPGSREGREHMATRERADRRRGARSLFALGGEYRRRLVGFEGAERRDARQDKAPRAARREQRLGQGLSSSLRRHVDCRVGQRRRSAGAGKVLNQDPVEERATQGGQKRRAGGNCEDSGLANGHARLLCGARGKASCVPGLSTTAKQGSFEKRARKPPPRVFVPRNPEPQPVRSVGERPGEDSRCEQPLKYGARVRSRREAKEARSADDT